MSDGLTGEQRARRVKALTARLHAGPSPAEIGAAVSDWAGRLALRPVDQVRLLTLAHRLALGALVDSDLGAGPDHPGAGAVGARRTPDPRFEHPLWRRWPWSRAAALTHAAEVWWERAVEVDGLDPRHRDLTLEVARQLLDLAAPSNLAWFNPAVLERTRDQLGMNLLTGLQHAAEREFGGGAAGPRPGAGVAQTPGRVVLRTRVAELIQYEPLTSRVAAEPVLFVPSWFGRYHLLDLSPGNSLVRWLVMQGHTVCVVSWVNPGADDRHLTVEDYLRAGVLEPLAELSRRTGGRPAHAAGHGVGGALLAGAAAHLSSALAGITLLQTDPAGPRPFDPDTGAILSELIDLQGFATGAQLAAASRRHPQWSSRIAEVLLDRAAAAEDLRAWSADAPRVPAGLLRARLSPDWGAIDVPVFVLAAESDRCVPWTEVYGLHQRIAAELTFALTNGDRHDGLLSEPTRPRRRVAIGTRPAGSPLVRTPGDWATVARQSAGSWWPHWHRWLLTHGSGERVPARSLPAHLPPAPGEHVRSG